MATPTDHDTSLASREATTAGGDTSSVAVAWLKALSIYVGALTTLVIAITKLNKYVKNLFQCPTWLWVSIAALPLVVAFATNAIPSFIRRRREKELEEWGVKGETVLRGYFRIGPYEQNEQDRYQYKRADNAHVAVFEWLSKSPPGIIYLSGVSGAGKSSLINAHVLPTLKNTFPSLTCTVLRAIDDPLTVLCRNMPQSLGGSNDAGPHPIEPADVFRNLKSQLGTGQLLIVFDQFEEMLIMHQRDPQTSTSVRQLFRMLRDEPILGLKVLLVLRSDYIVMIEDPEWRNVLPLMQQGVNWKEVGPFLERDARAFLQGSGLQIGPKLMDDLFQQIEQLEGTAGLVRPITVNMIGTALDAATIEVARLIRQSRWAGGLLLNYLRAHLEQPEIAPYARKIAAHMITAAGTKEPRDVATIATLTSFKPAVVVGCLLRLQQVGIVRPLDPQQSYWEIAHDFVAHLLDRLMRSWRRSAWARLQSLALPFSFVVWLSFFVVAPMVLQANLPAGEALLFDGNTHYKESGFSFTERKPVPWSTENGGEADILFAGSRLFTQNNLGDLPGVMENAPADKNAHGGIQRSPSQNFSDSCPIDGYIRHWFPPNPADTNSMLVKGGYYCVRLRDGNHYAKIKITGIEPDRIAFEWVYQPSGSRTFR